MTTLFKKQSLCFLSMLIASFCNQAYSVVQARMSCAASAGQIGNCVALPQCKQALDIIQINGILSYQAQTFLRNNLCGYEGRDPKVCCSQGGGTRTFPPPTDPWNNNWNDKTTTTTQSPQFLNPLMLLPRDCGLDESDRIVGGTETALGEFPWMAILEYRNAENSETYLICGGTLITKRYVLTAAHCVLSAPSYMILNNVRLGEHDVTTNPDCRYNRNGHGICANAMLSVPIERLIIHESYNVPHVYRNDIALLRLAHDLTFTRYIKPICLPTSATASERYWSAGWGATETQRASGVKLKVNLPYVDLDRCAPTYSSKRVALAGSQMCAGGQAGRDTCKGDSGGPLMKQVSMPSGPNRWVIDGVLSIGHTPCGVKGWPGVYTKVYDYVRWIVSRLEP